MQKSSYSIQYVMEKDNDIHARCSMKMYFWLLIVPLDAYIQVEKNFEKIMVSRNVSAKSNETR